ncbi:MAG TPA: hypothetical protein GX686_11010 [Paracoccus sp.]|nr:hypothetical protein [Paracoccus sp. (in: a-proteobacteria)]
MAGKSILRRWTAKRPTPDDSPEVMAPPRRVASTDDLVERLLNAKTSNEIAAIAGLPPITGLSGPKIVY